MTEIIHIEPSTTITVFGGNGDATVYNTTERQNGTLVWVDKMGNLKSSECEVVTTIIHGGIYGDEVDEKYYVYGSEVPEKRIIKFVEND